MPLQFVTFLSRDELQPGQREVFDVGNISILLLNVDGEYFAIENMCSHEEWELADGEIVDGCEIECTKHGARFDLRTGEHRKTPAYFPIQVFPTRIEGDEVQVQVDIQS